MKLTHWRIVVLLILTLAAQLLLGCGTSIPPSEPELPPTPGDATPLPAIIEPANPIYQTVVAEAQATVEVETTQTAQAVAVPTAYQLTSTAVAATQTASLVQEYNREQQNFVDRVVSPLIPIVAAILLILLFILFIVLVQRQLIPIPWPRPLLNPRERVNDNSMIEGVIIDPGRQPHRIDPSGLTPGDLPGLPCEKLVVVEIVNANEPPVDHWIDEVEQQLFTEGG